MLPTPATRATHAKVSRPRLDEAALKPGAGRAERRRRSGQICCRRVWKWHMADALRRNGTVSYLGVTRRARGVPRSRPIAMNAKGTTKPTRLARTHAPATRPTANTRGSARTVRGIRLGNVVCKEDERKVGLQRGQCRQFSRLDNPTIQSHHARTDENRVVGDDLLAGRLTSVALPASGRANVGDLVARNIHAQHYRRKQSDGCAD
jgi:hypothetical protein